MKNIVNILAFQAVWFASVIGAASGRPWLGAALLLPFTAWQLAVSDDPAYDRRAIALLCVAGLVIDSIYPLAGMLSYAAAWPSAMLAPVWLVLMWVNLALTLNHSLAWLRGRPVLAALFGGSGGALSYYAGFRLGAMELHWEAPATMALIGLVWSLSLPALYGILDRMAALSNGPVPSPR